MSIRKMPLEELELLSYADIAYEILKEDKKSKTTPALFGEVCKLLEIGEDAMFDMIGDFYTTLTTDKRFLLLDSSEWDLKEFHIVKTIIDDEESEEEESEEEEAIEGTEDEAVMGDPDDYDDIDEVNSSIEGLMIIDENEYVVKGSKEVEKNE